MDNNDHYGKLTHQQQRFCDLYLTHFNAFKAAIECGYSENTSRKGALLHVPKIQQYLKERMAERSQRLEITHDMILRELSKIAFSNMGNYYDEYGCLKRMNELTVDEKGVIAYYDIVEIQDGDGYRVGQQSRIKLHNKMSALDKIARHLNFYGTLGVEKQEARGMKQEAFLEEEEESGKDGLLVTTPTKAADVDFEGAEDTPLTPLERGNRFERDVVIVDKSINNLPMDYPVEDFELEGIDLKTQMALEGVNVSPGSLFEPEESPMSESRQVRKIEFEESPKSEGAKDTPLTSRNIGTSSLERGTENVENILTISPLAGSLVHQFIGSLVPDGEESTRQNALRMGADTGPSSGSGQAPVAKACAV